ncbi:MAG TPA: hypothetical protein VFV98_13265, partial [Vicinamibacterales bacterium]|nr:hypothetical protein [Vicinamibacterales bacterium]
RRLTNFRIGGLPAGRYDFESQASQSSSVNPAIWQSPEASIRQFRQSGNDCGNWIVEIWQSNPAMPSIRQSGNCAS